MAKLPGLSLLRAQLKLQLLREESDLCPLCGKPGVTDLHEAFLKRGDLPPRRQWELRHLLFSPANCVVLHNWCHLEMGQTREAELQLARYKLSRGYDLQTLFQSIEDEVPAWTSPAWNRQSEEVV